MVRYIDVKLAQRRQGLEEKIPDIQKILDTVEHSEGRASGLAHLISDSPDPLLACPSSIMRF